ncbi:hypothetical protein IAT38_000797 [Cryptococcus sp. DSM 104549]
MAEYFLRQPCSIAGCTQGAVGSASLCGACPGTFCVDHIDDPLHQCSIFLNDIDSIPHYGALEAALKDSIWEHFHSVVAKSPITDQATLLRDGHPCRLAVSSLEARQSIHGGSINHHIPLVFDDGVKWMVRIRPPRVNPLPGDLQQTVTKSEVATHRLLRGGGVRHIPNAWLPLNYGEDDSPKGEEDLHLDYFFVEYVEGEAYTDWTRFLVTDAVFSADVTRQFFDDLVRHYISLANVPHGLKGIGSICPSADGGFALGPLQGPGPVTRPTPPYFWGPFKTNRERILRIIDGIIEYIMTFAIKLQYPVRVLLWFMEIREMVDGDEEMAREETEFYIKHGDDALGQYMKDEKGRITGVLDWEWSYITTKTEAFAACGLLYRADQWATDPSFISKEEHLLMETYNRLGRPDIADCIPKGRIYQALHLQMRYILWHHPGLGIINVLRWAFLGDKAEMFTSVDEWEMMAFAKYRETPLVREFCSRLRDWYLAGLAKDPAMKEVLKQLKGEGGGTGNAQSGVDGTEGGGVVPGEGSGGSEGTTKGMVAQILHTHASQ